jgi:hypothetical protein
VAVWAEHAQVFESVVVADAVDVVELDAERFTLPIAEATLLASILKQTRAQQPSLNRVSASARR